MKKYFDSKIIYKFTKHLQNCKKKIQKFGIENYCLTKHLIFLVQTTMYYHSRDYLIKTDFEQKILTIQV